MVYLGDYTHPAYIYILISHIKSLKYNCQIKEKKMQIIIVLFCSC